MRMTTKNTTTPATMNSISLTPWPQIEPVPPLSCAAEIVVETAISTPKTSRPAEASSSICTEA